MPPTKAKSASEQLKLEKKKFAAKEKKRSEENYTKEQALIKKGEKPGQTKLFK